MGFGLVRERRRAPLGEKAGGVDGDGMVGEWDMDVEEDNGGGCGPLLGERTGLTWCFGGLKFGVGGDLSESGGEGIAAGGMSNGARAIASRVRLRFLFSSIASIGCLGLLRMMLLFLLVMLSNLVYPFVGSTVSSGRSIVALSV